VVQYYASDAQNPDNKQISAHLQITNDTASAFQLSKVTLRYYYTDDDPNFPIDTFVCDFAAIGMSKLIGAPVAMPMPAMNADHYIEIGFKASAPDLSAHSDSGDIQVRFYNAMLNTINQLNDYSFSTANTQFTDYANITLYNSGCLVWGTEPQ
jgi:hypothetical protein